MPDCPERSEEEAEFVIVEQGAHDGQLARDILAALDERNSPLADLVEYRIVEPRPAAGRRLRQRLEEAGGDPRIRVLTSLADARAERGIFLANELLDAFPVKRVVRQGGRWRELCVGLADDGPDRFTWIRRPLEDAATGKTAGEDASLSGGIEPLLPSGDFPEGYTTEICPALGPWMEDTARLFRDRGQWWIIDYGHEAEDYFSPERREGTLRCYHRHRAGDDPFATVGESDLTAHVNFTHLKRYAEREGLRARALTDQHHFLVEAARPWLLSLEGKSPSQETAKELRQFQTLTHPDLMGRGFKVAIFEKG